MQKHILAGFAPRRYAQKAFGSGPICSRPRANLQNTDTPNRACDNMQGMPNQGKTALLVAVAKPTPPLMTHRQPETCLAFRPHDPPKVPAGELPPHASTSAPRSEHQAFSGTKQTCTKHSSLPRLGH